jgi:hypothetical protein
MAVERLVTMADVDDKVPDDRHVSVKARHEAVLTGGRRLLLLDDRGWGSTQPWTTALAEDIAETTRVVVGPDEPAEGRTKEEAEADHWTSLAQILQRHRVSVDAQELRQLPHDVVLSERLLAHIGRDPSTAEPVG